MTEESVEEHFELHKVQSDLSLEEIETFSKIFDINAEHYANMQQAVVLH